jgi:hypothetical protein
MSAEEHTEANQAKLGGSFAGSLPNLPDITWEDFERASELAQRDLLDGQGDRGDSGASYSSSKAPVDR